MSVTPYHPSMSRPVRQLAEITERIAVTYQYTRFNVKFKFIDLFLIYGALAGPTPKIGPGE
jgi:hypothetical protein